VAASCKHARASSMGTDDTVHGQPRQAQKMCSRIVGSNRETSESALVVNGGIVPFIIVQ